MAFRPCVWPLWPLNLNKATLAQSDKRDSAVALIAPGTGQLHRGSKGKNKAGRDFTNAEASLCCFYTSTVKQCKSH